MKKTNAFKLTFAIAGLAAAGVILYGHFSGGDAYPENAFFYDLSEKELFEAPRTLIPPIKGINDDEEDGVSAVVISVTGDPKDKSSRKIAYLEKYSPELKRDLEQAQRTGEASQIGRAQAQLLRFVRTESDTNWHPLASERGEQIIAEWAVPGPDGVTPVVCTP